jgi:hypothetical protein
MSDLKIEIEDQKAVEIRTIAYKNFSEARKILTLKNDDAANSLNTGLLIGYQIAQSEMATEIRAIMALKAEIEAIVQKAKAENPQK